MDLKLLNVRMTFPKGENTLETPSDYYDPAKYCVQILIPKNDPQVQAFEDAVNAAVAEGKAKYGKSFNPGTYKVGGMLGTSKFLQDGDLKDVDILKGYWFFTPTSQWEVPIFSPYKPEKISASEVWSGDYGNVKISICPFVNTVKNNKGVAVYLKGVQPKFKGERLGEMSANEFDYEAAEDASNEVVNF